MASIQITETVYFSNRAKWRAWLAEHYDNTQEIWLIFPTRTSGEPRIPYLDAVEEALCFGWIDGIAKKLDADHTVQRFTPRRSKSHWTELNKERARRLIAAGKMTPAGSRVLPDLSPEAFQIPADILAALKADPQVWENFEGFPGLYQRIRISFIEEMRKQPEQFQKRLQNFLEKTRQNKRFGQME